MIRARDLSYSYGLTPVFSGINFQVSKGDKVGLVGPNGAGKSTLFRLICGQIDPDDGRLETHGRILAVPQEVKRDPEMEAAESVADYLDPKRLKEEHQMKRILARLELGHLSLDDAPQYLSGGQKTKLAIARALVQEPDILLLDEPTNFLDTAGKQWVMEFLGKYPKSLLIISHDLVLLDQNITKILDINIVKHQIEEYTGNYTNYVKLKEEKDALLVRQITSEKKHIARMKEGLVKMAHLKSDKGVRQRLNLEKRVEQAIENLPAMPAQARKLKMVLPDPSWVGSMPILAQGISKSFGSKKVLDHVNFDILRSERIALMGPNGAGKSTLIKIIMGMIKPDSGDILLDDKINIGYYSQEFETFDFNDTPFKVLQDKYPAPENIIRANLGRFLFTGDQVFQKISSLSGGEKTRLSIALLLVQKFNLLILDEPTTYLDVLSQRLILEALKQYKGAMIIVSHTPEFIEELKPSRKFLLPENKYL